MNNFHDPRTDISHPVNIGQVYIDDRTEDAIKIIYADEDTILLRDKDGNHRLEPRETFEANIGGGRYSLDDGQDFGYAGRLEAVSEAQERYESEDGRKAGHKAEALSEALSLLTEKNVSFETVPFEDLDGVGASTASNLRASGYKTVEDVRRASDEELLDVRGVGEANLESIRGYA